MLRGTDNGDFYSDYYSIIRNSQARCAYLLLIGWASTLRGYECFPASHGVVKDFRFMRGKQWDFAFIPNQGWLLFYFRKPCLRLEKYTGHEILTRFPEANKTPAGEFTVKVSRIDQAIAIANYVES